MFPKPVGVVDDDPLAPRLLPIQRELYIVETFKSRRYSTQNGPVLGVGKPERPQRLGTAPTLHKSELAIIPETVELRDKLGTRQTRGALRRGADGCFG